MMIWKAHFLLFSMGATASKRDTSWESPTVSYGNLVMRIWSNCSCFPVAGVQCEKGTPKHLHTSLLGVGNLEMAGGAAQGWGCSKEQSSQRLRSRTPAVGPARCPHRPNGTMPTDSYQELRSQGRHHRYLKPAPQLELLTGITKKKKRWQKNYSNHSGMPRVLGTLCHEQETKTKYIPYTTILYII